MSQQPDAAKQDEAIWRSLCDHLERDPHGRELLNSIRTDSQGGFARFEAWLREQHDALPKPIQIKVSGGEIRDLWTIAEVHNLNVQSPPAPNAAQQREQRNRTLMLNLVAREWVEGWLDESVEQTQRLRIDLEFVPSAIPDPWVDLMARPSRSDSAGQPASMLEAFNNLGHRLLILGAPGAGKTTALLELTRSLITRAELKPSDPIPVVFLLAAWAADRPAFATWLVDELVRRYKVSRSLSEAWVKGDQILPLLDGLDEVPIDARAACVDAINVFQATRHESLSELVVTCRIDSYFALGPRLNLSGAVMLKPLTAEAIDARLTLGGTQLEGVRQALGKDRTLRELASTPMVLDLLTRTYRGAAPGSLPLRGDGPVRLEQLFGAYAELMLRRRGGTHYTRQQAAGWLAWLANALRRESQTVLYIERLQPHWITTRRDRFLYSLVDRLGFGLLLGALEGILVGLVLDPVSALGFGGVVAIAVSLAGGTMAENPSGWRLASSFLLGGIATGGLTTLLLGMATGLNVVTLLNGALLGAVVGAPLSGLAGGPQIGSRRIHLVERVSWSLKRALRSAAGSVSVVLFLALILVLSALGQRQDAIRIGLLVAIALGAPPALVIAVLGGFESEDLDDETKRLMPNQGIWHGAHTAMVAAGLSALASGLSIAIVFGAFGQALGPSMPTIVGGPVGSQIRGAPQQLQVLLVLGLIFASLYGLIGGLAYGGYAYLSHFALRFVLWRERAMPLDYVRFLDYSSDCALLRKVGGGYMFVHRFLQDHFIETVRDLRH